MRLERWRLGGGRLERDAVLVDDVETGDVHDSGRIRFGPDGGLYLATGDAGDPDLSQDPASLNGKMLRLTPEQYRGAGPVRPTVVASGLRNPQGLDWQPGTGQLYATDHGPSGFDGPEGYDEVNAITEGADYGWPTAMSDDDGDGRFAVPVRIWREAIAPSGAAFVTRAGSPWQGRLVVAGLRGEQLRLLELEDGRVVGDQPLLTGRYGRLRSVTEGPDGALYVLTSNRDGRGSPVRTDDRILRVRLPDA